MCTVTTTFDRKAFSDMLDDIDSKKIDCIIVSDLSRFGRSEIETAFYIERLLPSKGVRFISINDDFDTLNGLNEILTGNLFGTRIPITNLFNSEYSADISRKVQASIDMNIQNGKYVAPRAPYGYIKSPHDCHKLIVDNDAAVVVKDIFVMAFNKVALNEIVRRLNIAKIPTPINYAISNGLKGNYDQGNGAWNTRTVKKMLMNRTYTGDLEQGKNNVLVENTHEALVDKKMFDSIQEMFMPALNDSPKSALIPNPLKGKVICASCGGKMQRKKGSGKADWHFFTCITNNRIGSGCDTGMYIRESAIIDAIQSKVSDKAVNGTIEHQLKSAIIHHDKSVEVCLTL